MGLGHAHKCSQREDTVLADLEAASRLAGVPEWWARAVAVEYLDCRRFAGKREIWEFDFSLVSDADLATALTTSRVLIGATVFHNVSSEGLHARIFGGIIGAVRSRMSRRIDQSVPEGLVGAHAVQLLGNPIDVWDPKLSLGEHVLVRGDDGRIYQWHVATFVPVPETSHGEWTSEVVDLSSFDEVRVRLARLRNPPVVRRPGEPGHAEFSKEVAAFYVWLESLRAPIRDQLWLFHRERLTKPWTATGVALPPPTLSLFEEFEVRDGEMFTRLHGEPLFLRACIQHVEDASRVDGTIHALDRSIASRAQAVITAAAFLETFINGVGADSCSDGSSTRSSRWRASGRHASQRQAIPTTTTQPGSPAGNARRSGGFDAVTEQFAH
jgi:hypothetical protein